MGNELKPCPICNGKIKLLARCRPDFFGIIAKCEKCENEFELKTKLKTLKNGISISRSVIPKATKEWNFRKEANDGKQ